MAKNKAAVSLGKLGGQARAKSLSAERRKEIAASGQAALRIVRKLKKEKEVLESDVAAPAERE